MKISSVILAAGQGTRMQSQLPKVLAPILGQTDAAICDGDRSAGDQDSARGDHWAWSREQFARLSLGRHDFVLQEPQLGTGHAVQQAEALLAEQADLVSGDLRRTCRCLPPQTLEQIVQAQKGHSGPMTMLTMLADHARGFGRIVRDERTAGCRRSSKKLRRPLNSWQSVS